MGALRKIEHGVGAGFLGAREVHGGGDEVRTERQPTPLGK